MVNQGDLIWSVHVYSDGNNISIISTTGDNPKRSPDRHTFVAGWWPGMGLHHEKSNEKERIEE